MASWKLWAGVALALFVAWPGKPQARGAAPAALDEKALAARIDQHLAAGWTAVKVEPAPRADDAEFLRRAYLDLAGRIPSVAEARAFLDDTRPDKRERLVATILDGPRYIAHFGRVWRSLLLPEATTNFQIRFQAPSLESWLRARLSKNVGYDVIVRELLTLPVGNGGNPRAMALNGRESTPVAFYTAKEVKAENLAAATSRLFLGFRLECAQCHNHPFASWKRTQFWELAAFFSGLQRSGPPEFAVPSGEKGDRREITIPGLETVAKATFPNGKAPQWKETKTAREVLAEWITAPENPYFARATVNRMWAYFFGTGLVDPVDEMVGSEHVASHPALLDELSRQFVEHKYDLKYLIKAITASRAYQLTSARTHASQDDPRQFARMPLRGLSPEQLLDSIAEATGYREGSGQRNAFFNDGSARGQLLQLFTAQSEKSTEQATSILQALALMNGRLTSEATDVERSVTLAAIADAPFLDSTGRIEALYLATLARKPSQKELSRFVAYVERGGSEAGTAATPPEQEKRYRKALADVFWALLNTGEFMLNH